MTRYEIENKVDFTSDKLADTELGQIALSESIAVYVWNNPREENDFQSWCQDNDLGLVIRRDHLNHIYGQVLYFLYNCGYDIDYTFDVE